MSDFVAFLRRQIAMDMQSARAMPHAIENMQSRWSPAQLLADAESKLATLELHAPMQGRRDSFQAPLSTFCAVCSEFVTGDLLDGDPYPCQTVRLLGVKYAGLRGYREEWKP